jgi:pentatricopeptide repeat protein
LALRADVVTYNSVIGVLGRAAMVDDALAVFERMRRPSAAIKPDAISYARAHRERERRGEE